MNTERICPNCRKALAPDVPLGLCPECLIKSGLSTDAPIGSAPAANATASVAAARFVPPPVEEIAKLFPQFEILNFIGQGGMGAVYKARQPGLDRFVALKVLPPAMGSDPGFAERFNREARALARLNHPNIVAVHDFGQAGPLHYLLMEFVDGANLREIEQAGKLSPDQAVSIVPQICEALQFAHNEGIVHRDIKPENLLLDKKGRLKITDFGIAKIIGVPAGKSALTGARDVMGTPHYMAPEQIENPQSVDHRADIYSLGVVFYEMLTGELPLGRFAPPSQRAPMDARLDDVVMHTLEKSPEQRYQQASQVKTDVETIATTAAPLTSSAKPAGKAGTLPSGSPLPPYSGLSPSAADRPPVSDKLILPAFLLAFFFGVFGAHRFYVGKIGTAFMQAGGFLGGILMVVACGIIQTAHLVPGIQIFIVLMIILMAGLIVASCVWATADWIFLLCRVFTDSQGRRLTKWLHSDPVAAASASTQSSGGANPSAFPGFAAASSSVPPGTPPQNPPGSSGSGQPVSHGMIVAPAVGLIIAGFYKLLSSLSVLSFIGWSGNRMFNSIFSGFGPFSSMHLGPVLGINTLFFGVIPAVLIIFGGFEMLRLRSHCWAVTAAIIAIVACSLIGLPVGIWALVVLMLPSVREKFSNQPGSMCAIKWIAITAGVFICVLLFIAALNLFPSSFHSRTSRHAIHSGQSVDYQPVSVPMEPRAPTPPAFPDPPTNPVLPDPPTPPIPPTPGAFLQNIGDDQHFSAAFAVIPVGALTLDVDCGDIRVTASDTTNFSVKIDREVTRADRALVSGILIQENVTIKQEGNQVTITAEQPAPLRSRSWWGLADQPNLNAHYEITVPRKFDVQLQTAGGDERVSGLQGNLKLDTSGGRLECKDITGDIDGRTSGGDIKADDCQGELHLDTSGGNVNIENFTGPGLHATTSGGNMSADFAITLKSDCELRTSGGNVTATLPATAAVTVDAHTSGGFVRTELPVETTGKLDDGSLIGPINGGGPRLKLETSGGNIELMKR